MVKVKNDLTGMKFGRLTVIRQAEDHITKGGQKHAAWLCQCDCGSSPKVIVGGDLTRKNRGIKSCGCLKENTENKVKVKEDLKGQNFGRWTVLEQTEDHIAPDGIHHAQWLCQCSCGSEPKPVVGYALKRGTSQSCGCLANELKTERQKKYNTYDLSGDFGIGYTSNGEEFWFDLEDYDKIKDYCWHYGTGGYVKTSVNDERKQLFLHREIMGVSDESWLDVIVDHRKHGKMDERKYDNRKENLRKVTRTRNNQNTHKRKDNTSGVTGVHWNKRRNAWCAAIQVNKKHIELGYFDDFNEAVKARKKAEEKYFGEYSFDNSQKPLNEEKGA